MERYFIYAVMLYALVVVIYLLWERGVKRRKNAARKKGYNPFRATPKEDIIGKSKFTLRHSKPQATTLEINEKGIENASIFATENGQTVIQDTPGEVLQNQTGTGALPGQSEDNSGEIDLVIENEPEGELDNDEDGDLDTWESEAEGDGAGSSMAQGIGFDELAGMVRPVEAAGTATTGEREEAGRVLVEIRKTEIFEQIANDEPKKKVVSSLMDDYFSAFYRRTEALPDGAVKAPADFNVRGFA